MSKIDLLTQHTKDYIDHWVGKYPLEQKQSAVLAALREVQHQNDGHITTELMNAVAEYLEMSEIAVYEVASFYSIYATKPCGKHHISVCNNISCMLMGADEITTYIEDKLGIQTGESTPDGKFYLKIEEECLAACDGGPMMQVDHVYHENLTTEKVDQILDAVED